MHTCRESYAYVRSRATLLTTYNGSKVSGASPQENRLCRKRGGQSDSLNFLSCGRGSAVTLKPQCLSGYFAAYTRWSAWRSLEPQYFPYHLDQN